MPEIVAPSASMRRNVAILAAAQVLFQSTQGMSIATTPLAAFAMLDNKILATVPVFLTHFGLMSVTLPAALLMGRIGRRGGFTIGAALGILGGITSCIAVFQQQFWILCVGAYLQGASGAFAWHYRFAATDVASGAWKPKALSLVMAGGVVAGVLGPETAKRAVDLLAPVTFAGVYIALAAFSLGMMALVQLVSIPRPTAAERAKGGRPMREIARQPAFITAVLASMIGYAVMTLVMSATPLAMKACGFQFSDSATVIQWHVVAMFLPAFLTGHLIARFGAPPIIAIGALFEIGCALVNFSGMGFANFIGANVLVGLGWNFCYVGGSALLTTTYRPEEKAKVQGTHDFLVYSMTASAAALSGTLQASAGWLVLNAAALPLLTIVLIAAGWHALGRGRTAQVARA